MTPSLAAEQTAREENNAALIADLDYSNTQNTHSAYDIDVSHDPERGRWLAALGTDGIGELTYRYVGGRVVLLTTWVNPAFRNQHVAGELVRRALDEIRDMGKKITIICPVVGEIIAHHTQYLDLVDPKHPGAGAHPERSGTTHDEELEAFEADLA